MKRRAQGFFVFFTILSLCLSFCNFNAFAKSKYYDEGESYNDSYLKDGYVNEDSTLVFFPPFPESNFRNYILLQSEKSYFLVLTTSSRMNFYGDNMVAQEPFVVYRYSEHDRQWIYDDNNEPYYPWNKQGWYKTFKNHKFIDTSIVTDSGSVIVQNKYTAKTGYRFYWQIITIEKFIINQIESMTDYVLQNKILTYIVLGGFAGEVIFFVTKLIRRVGDLKYEQEDTTSVD